MLMHGYSRFGPHKKQCIGKGMVVSMKRSAGRMFIKIFIRSFIIVGILFLAGILSYKAAMFYWQPKDKEAEVAFEEDSGQGEVVIADKEGISRNLICCYDSETDEITELMLEVFDSDSTKITYITIPVKTQLTLSDSLYQKLILDEPEIPQVLKLSTIAKYLDGAKTYADELLIVEELLHTNINYYTAIPKETYDTMFTDKYVKQSDQYDAVPMQVFTNDYKKILNSLDTRDKLKEYTQELYPKLQSDLPLEDKLNYLDNYDEASFTQASFQLLPGKNLNDAYIVDSEHIERQMKELTGID